MSIGNAAPNFAAYASAKGAMDGIMEIVRRVSPIDASSEAGRKLDTVQGKIEFKGVHFFYPNRSNVQVLTDFSLTVNPGETVALVGHSGCGKG